MDSLMSTLKAWRNILGSENVLTDEPTLEAARTATFFTTQSVPAVIRPSNRVEVQECVRIANRYKTPIYPISTGKNWGYGSRVPVEDGCVIMDLGRLNRIVDYDEKLAYATVEPGVTIRQLYEFLREKKSTLRMSITGSTLDSSVVGNVLERGLGSGLYVDRFGHVCAMEVVLPTGECIHTGFERFPNAKAARVSRWGVGPYLDGIFTQSNLGIVTQMTIWLMSTPNYYQACFFAIKDDTRLEALVDTLQTLKFEGGCVAPIHLHNDWKILSSIIQYPWQAMGDRTLLSSDLMSSIRAAFGIGMWHGVLELHSLSEEHGKAMREMIQQLLVAKVDELDFVDNKQGPMESVAAKRHLSLINLLNIKDDSEWISNDGSIQSTYWRKKTPIPSTIDPDRDHCGVIWCAPSIPFNGKHVEATVKIIEQTLTSYRFEPIISLNCITERNVIVTTALLYDRDVAGEDARALMCHDTLLQKLTEEGYFPYRLGIQSMNSLQASKDDYGKLLSTLKTALDPNNILAPGRYDFRTDWPENQSIRDADEREGSS